MSPKISATVILFTFLCLSSAGQNISNLNDADNKGVVSQNNIRKTPIDIGSRLELFIDDYIVEKLTGEAEFQLHHPTPKEIVIEHDKPWEGSGSGYHSIFKDGDKYKMYYKAWQHKASETPVHPGFCCYAESDDGIHWRKPNLGLYEFQGSKSNNIVFESGFVGDVEIDAAHPAVFRDNNPNTSPDALYKAFILSSKPRGLMAFKSADGIHWKAMNKTPVLTNGKFDSQNLAFWDSVNNKYRAYWRYMDDTIRAIRTATSQDFIHWNGMHNLNYTDSPKEQLYTNQIKPYYRAPHILIGFPVRYINRGWSASTSALPEPEHRRWRSDINRRYGTALTETLLMASRDGVTFKRWNEAFLRPGIERKGTWNYGQQYMGWSVVETKSALEGAPNELSIYAVENYWTGTSCSLRRYTLRMDGFVSVSAPANGGEMVTRPIVFSGDNLVLNFSSSAAGGIQVEILDENGEPLPGYSLHDCSPVFGDSVKRVVPWGENTDLSSLKGKIIKLRFVLKDADLYSFRFH